jgi:hypothetical protein
MYIASAVADCSWGLAQQTVTVLIGCCLGDELSIAQNFRIGGELRMSHSNQLNGNLCSALEFILRLTYVCLAPSAASLPQLLNNGHIWRTCTYQQCALHWTPFHLLSYYYYL